jgi:hypothetical protein
MTFNRMSAALSVLILRNFSKILLRARRTLKFSHSLGHSRHSQLAPKSTFVRCWSNRRQNLVPSVCPRSATSGLMHRSKPHFYSITSSARASSLAGISRYYGAIATSVFNDLDYIFLAPNWKRLVPDQKPLGELRPGPTYMAGRSKPSPRINIKTFQVGQQTGSTVWPRYAQVTTLRCEPDRPTPPSIGSHASLNTAIASARVGA